MDKGTAQSNKIGNNLEIREVEYDEIISADEHLRNNDAHNKSIVDPLSITEEENNAVEALKKEVPLKQDKEDGFNNFIANNITGFVKIAPKSNANATVAGSTSSITATASSSVPAARTSNGKIIYLQRPGGASVPVRVPATIATKSSSSNLSKPAVAIHVIRTPDGNLVPIKNNKGINISNVNQLTGKKLIPAMCGKSGSMLIKTPVKAIPDVGPAGLATTVVGSTTISSMEKIRSKTQQIITSKSIIGNSNGGTSANNNTIIQNITGNRQIMVPKGMIKISPRGSSGKFQAIHIPGKSGIQYVRLLNNTAGVVAKMNKPDVIKTTTKYTVINQAKPPVKIMIKSPTNGDKKIINTVPTLKKINESVLKPSAESGEGDIIRLQKTPIIGPHTQRTKIYNEEKIDVSVDEYIANINKPLIRNIMASQHQKANIPERSEARNVANQCVPSGKKLYTVLKPDTAYKDMKLKSRAEAMYGKQASLHLTNNPTTGHSIGTPSLPADESAVTIRRKHCNCTKSQCLKLYCDCFANGEFCQDCNCKDCLNNLDNEDERQKAIRICLERNPNSFKPKITVATHESDQRLHNKGCNCKRSGCLKNYCECYEAKIPCSSNCKCIGCRNVEDHPDLDMDVKKGPISAVQTFGRVKRTYDDMIKSRSPTLPSSTSSSIPASTPINAVTTANIAVCGVNSEKQPCNFITQEVVDATIQCLIAQADECKKGCLTPYQTEKMIMEELGRCLVEIIDFSIRNTDQN